MSYTLCLFLVIIFNSVVMRLTSSRLSNAKEILSRLFTVHELLTT